MKGLRKGSWFVTWLPEFRESKIQIQFKWVTFHLGGATAVKKEDAKYRKIVNQAGVFGSLGLKFWCFGPSILIFLHMLDMINMTVGSLLINWQGSPAKPTWSQETSKNKLKQLWLRWIF